MTAADIAGQYRIAWQEFVDQALTTFAGFAEIAAAENPGSLHDLLAHIHPVPYDEMHRLIDGVHSDSSSNNVGSATGLFFEQAVAAIITGYLRPRVPGVRLERNTCSARELAAVARDPDVLVSANGRHVVFEVKVAPKKSDLGWGRRLRESYRSLGAEYYLVGGYASLTSAELRTLESEKWACFVTGSLRNRASIERLPRLDALLAHAAAFLLNPREVL